MMLIDTHVHLTMDEFSDLPEVLKRAKEAGVSAIINASFDLGSSERAVDLAGQHGMLYSAVGIHPHHADTMSDGAVKRLHCLACGSKVVAIGETGLDYFENPVPKDVQKASFLRHIELAVELSLPMIIHGRESNEDILEILKENGKGIKGVFHCFSGDEAFADRVLDMGFLVSFTAIITFKNAHRMRDAVKHVPIEKIMLETDCPYLAPQMFRGKRNEPSYVRFVAQKIAEIKQLSPDSVAEFTTRNAKSLFSLP